MAITNYWLSQIERKEKLEAKELAEDYIAASACRKQRFVFDNSLIIKTQCAELIDLILESENEMLLAEDI